MTGILVIFSIIQLVVCDNVAEKLVHQSENITNEVTIYTESNFWGVHWTMTISNCTDVPALLYKKASSIDTHENCVLLYSRQECQGHHVKIAPGTDGHSHLSEVDFDDEIASLKSCDSEEPALKKGSLRARRSVSIFNDIIGKLGTSGDDQDQKSDDSNSSQQNGGNAFQAVFQRLNLNNLFMNRFQTPSSENSAGGLLIPRFIRNT